MSPFQLVYEIDDALPTYLGIHVLKLIQESQVEPNDMQIRINETIKLQQSRKEVYNKTKVIQDNTKKTYDRITKIMISK